MSLILKLIFSIPSLLGVGSQVAALIPSFQGANFWTILEIIGKIIGLILGLAPKDKAQAKAFISELRGVLAVHKDAPDSLEANLADLHGRVRNACEGVGCPPSLK